MAARTITLVRQTVEGNRLTSTEPTHTIALPKVVIEKRTIPATAEANATYSSKVVHGSVDASADPLVGKISFEAVVRFPADCSDAGRDAALVTFRDLIASDEFTVAVATQAFQVF